MSTTSGNSLPADDRRTHKRYELECPIVLTDADGKELLRARTVNISDGGALVATSAISHVPQGARAEAIMRVSRTTPDTHMFEEFLAGVLVVRRQDDPADPAVALKFAQPLDLDLEV